MMLEQGKITQRQYERADKAELPVPRRTFASPARGPAPYFVNYVKDELVAHYGAGRVFGGGLKVRTTIDLDLQLKARAAIEKVLRQPGRAGRRTRRDRPPVRRREGDVRWAELPAEPVQPRGAGEAAARLRLQAVRARLRR